MGVYEKEWTAETLSVKLTVGEMRKIRRMHSIFFIATNKAR